MSVSRRSIFTGGAALSALGLIGLAGCSTAAPSTSSANQSTAPSAGGAPQQKPTTTFSAKSGLPDITGIKGEDIAFFKSQPDFFVDLNSLSAGDLKDRPRATLGYHTSHEVLTQRLLTNVATTS